MKELPEGVVYLYKIPRASKLRVNLSDGTKGASATFHHTDGMYSYCTIDGLEQNNVFHLSVMTPLKFVDGAYEIAG